MPNHFARFNQLLSQSIKNLGLRRSYFEVLYDVESFENAISQESDPIEVAATALNMFCPKKIVFGSNEHAAATAVIDFLDEKRGKPENDEQLQRIVDLAAAIPNRRDEYVKWGKAWYP